MHTFRDTYKDDRQLVSRIITGERAAQLQFIRNTEKLVAQIVYKMIRDPAERKDLAQDVYFKAFKGLGAFGFRCKLSSWIAGIAYRTCLDFLEKRREVLWEITGEEDENTNRYDVIDERSLTDFLQQRERKAIINTLLGNLPPVYATLLTLFYHEDLSVEEMTTITALPEGTIKNYLFRGRKALKEALLENFNKEDL